MPKISIIVPVYNVEQYIEKCLDSLVNQTLQDIEIIVVNDGSKDKSKEKIKKYMNKIKYFEKENGGLSSARNYGMEYATGEYIAFLDSDDYVEKNMYEEMYNLAKKENADLIECDFIWEWKNGKKRYDKRRKYKDKREMLKKPRTVAWNKLIKRNIIERNNIKFLENLIYEDLDFYYKLMPYIEKISYINKYFVHYTQRKDSISNKQTEKNADIFKIINNIFFYYKEKNIYKKYEKELEYMKRRILLGSSMKRILKIKDRKIRKKLIFETIKTIKEKQKEKEKKICFGITKLGIGGAERVLVDISNELAKEYEITIFTIYGGGELEKELNSNIKLINMYKKEKNNRLIPIYILICGKHIYNKYIRKKYNMEIAFLEGPITRIMSYKGKSKKIAWVHNDIQKVFGKSVKSRFKNFIDKFFYRKYDEIIFVSNQNKKSFEKIYGKISKRKVIYNYINKERIIKLSLQNIKDMDKFKKSFLTVARLTKQKGIDRLIRIHKRLINEDLEHKIYIIGDGEERKKLENEVKKMNIQNTFIFLGKKENPYPYMKKADYILLLSNYEGYGMVLEEAKILNKPVIITNTAATEAVQNYKKKIIVENNEESIFLEIRKILKKEGEELTKEKYINDYLLEEVKNEIININSDI